MPSEMTIHLEEFRTTIVTEQGTEPPCPFCQIPRVKRTDYIRCNPCGINWLDEERTLALDYLNRNPAVARHAALMAASPKKPAGEADSAAK